MESVVTALKVFSVMTLVIVCIGFGVWVAKKYLTPTHIEKDSLGVVTLGEYRKEDNKVRVQFTSGTTCEECVVDFNATFTYSDNQTKVVKGTAQPEAGSIEFVWTRYDSSADVVPVSLDLTAYIVNTLDKHGPVSKKTYSIMRS